MSVIVKGMSMPETCGECHFCRIDKYLRNDWCRIINENVFLDTKHYRCPLIDLPERHGRLIDADALYKDMMCGIKAGNYEEGYECYQNINNMDDCLDAVKYADTVIKAEGEE